LEIWLKRVKWSSKSGVLGGKKWVIGLEKLRVGDQNRKAKWCKMQVLFLKIDKTNDVEG